MIMFWIRSHLSIIKPLQSLYQTLPIFLLNGQPGLHQCLCDEPKIPKLTPICSTHHHTLVTYPHKILVFNFMLFVCVAVWSIDNSSDDEMNILETGPRV